MNKNSIGRMMQKVGSMLSGGSSRGRGRGRTTTKTRGRGRGRSSGGGMGSMLKRLFRR